MAFKLFVVGSNYFKVLKDGCFGVPQVEDKKDEKMISWEMGTSLGP